MTLNRVLRQSNNESRCGAMSRMARLIHENRVNFAYPSGLLSVQGHFRR